MNHLVSHPFNQHRIAIDVSTDTHLYFKHFPSSLTVYGGEDRSVDVQESSLLEETMNGHGCRVSETQNSGKSSRVCSQVRVLSDIFQSVDRATFKWIILPKNSNLQKFFQHIVPFLKCKKKVYWLYNYFNHCKMHLLAASPNQLQVRCLHFYFLCTMVALHYRVLSQQ